MHRKSLFISPLIPLPPPSLGLPFGLLLPLVISVCCLTLIWTIPCFLVTACPTPVPYKHSLCSSRCGGKCKASEGKSRGWEKAFSRQKPRQKFRLRQHQRHICHKLDCLHHLQPIPRFLHEIRHSKELNCGSDHILECPVRLEYWQSGSAQNCSHQGFLKALVSEVVEVTYGPDCWFAFKSGSMSEDLSPFQKLFILFYNGILKVKQCVNNTVRILTVFPTTL